MITKEEGTLEKEDKGKGRREGQEKPSCCCVGRLEKCWQASGGCVEAVFVFNIERKAEALAWTPILVRNSSRKEGQRLCSGPGRQVKLGQVKCVWLTLT